MFKLAHKTEAMGRPSYLCTDGQFHTPIPKYNSYKAKTFKTRNAALQAAAKWNIIYEDYAQVEEA